MPVFQGRKIKPRIEGEKGGNGVKGYYFIKLEMHRCFSLPLETATRAWSALYKGAHFEREDMNLAF